MIKMKKAAFWSTIGSVSVVLGLIGGFFLVDDRYAKCAQLTELKTETQGELGEHFTQTAQTLHGVLIDNRIANEKKEGRELEYEIKSQQRWIRQFPNDQEAMGELQDLRERRRDSETRLHQLELEELGH